MTMVLFKTYVFFAMFHQPNIPLIILYKDQYASKTRVFFYDKKRTSVKREVLELLIWELLAILFPKALN